MNARDIAIRTILGEAANESDMGQAAVAHVLINRASDPRWPSTIQDVALQNKQFSAWNKGAGGNSLVSKYGPGSPQYERAGAVYDAVASGQTPDPTGGATHYYSPAGMSALVNEGSQSNILPRWLQEQNDLRGGQTQTIGGHIFTGLADGVSNPIIPQAEQSSEGTPFASPQSEPTTLMDALAGFGEQYAPQIPQQQAQYAPPAPQIAPIQAQQYQPVKRDATEKYLQLFQSLRG